MPSLRVHQAGPLPPLLHLWQVRAQDGPPLPMVGGGGRGRYGECISVAECPASTPLLSTLHLCPCQGEQLRWLLQLQVLPPVSLLHRPPLRLRQPQHCVRLLPHLGACAAKVGRPNTHCMATLPSPPSPLTEEHCNSFQQLNNSGGPVPCLLGAVQHSVPLLPGHLLCSGRELPAPLPCLPRVQ